MNDKAGESPREANAHLPSKLFCTLLLRAAFVMNAPLRLRKLSVGDGLCCEMKL